MEERTKLVSSFNPLEALNDVQISSLPDPLPSLLAPSTGLSNQLHLLPPRSTIQTLHSDTVPSQFTLVSSTRKTSHSLNSIGNILEKGFKVVLEKGV